MCVTKKRLAISLVLVAALLSPSVALAQSSTVSTSDWSGLRTVAPETKLEVKLKNGKTVKGKLRNVSDTALSLTVSNKPVDLNQEDVLTVYQISGRSAKKPTLIGLAVGAGAGAAIGAAGNSNDGYFISKGQWAAGLSVLAGGAGALIGFAVGKSRHKKRVLIYEAK